MPIGEDLDQAQRRALHRCDELEALAQLVEHLDQAGELADRWLPRPVAASLSLVSLAVAHYASQRMTDA